MPRLTAPRLIACLVFIGIFAMAARPSLDGDTWWHLRAGAWMVEQRQVLAHDEFSTTRPGQPWFNHSWLAQILLYLVWNGYGYTGLNLATALVVSLAFWLVSLQMPGPAWLKAVILLLAAAASSVYWSAGPELLSFLLAAVFASVLEHYRWRGYNRLWLLPPLMALWVNLNGGFVLGFLLLLVTLGGQALSRLLRRSGPGVLPRRGLLMLGVATLACLAVVPLNPLGAELYLYPLRSLSPGLVREFVQEWQPPNFHLPSMQLFIGLCLALLAALGLSRRRIDLTDLAIISASTYLGLVAARNIPLAALLAPPIIMRHAASGLADLRASRPLAADGAQAGGGWPILNWALLLVALAGGLLKVTAEASAASSQRAVDQLAPVRAVDYLQTSAPPGPIFNTYQWGGYLTWRLYPDYPVFVDGRTDLYDDDLLQEYLDAVQGLPGYLELLDRYNLNLVLVETRSMLDQRMRREPDWRLLYADNQAVLYQRQPLAAGDNLAGR